MPSVESLLVGPLGWSVLDSQVAAVSAATKAGVAGQVHVISGISISASLAPTAAQSITLLDGATVLDRWEIPAAVFAPIIVEFKRPFVCASGALASLTSPSLGVGVRCSLTLRGFTKAF